MKKFFKKTEGFTLVELIVVIAILGILAGVGTVGYSGYIKKANLAADQQLLASLNQAYAAACIENGVDASKTVAANITIGDDKTVSKDDIVVNNPADKATAIQADFEKYFAGNETAKFKVATGLTFDPVRGAFIDPANNSERFAVSFAGGTVYLNPADIQKIQNSRIAEIDAGVILGKVDQAAGMINTIDEENAALLNGIIHSTAFRNYFAGIGVDTNKLILQYLGLPEDTDLATVPNADQYRAVEALQNNALVLYTASETGKITATEMDAFMTMVQGGNAKSELKTALGDTSNPDAVSKALAQTTMVYGLCTTYAQKKGDLTLVDDPIDALNMLSDPDFLAYVDSPEGKADMAGYIASMNTVSNGAQDPNAVAYVLLNGFNTPELEGVLSAAMGK